METFSALLAICAGNSPVPGEFPTQRPVTRSFDVYFDVRPNKRLSKESWGWWFETLSCPLWRHRNGFLIHFGGQMLPFIMTCEISTNLDPVRIIITILLTGKKNLAYIPSVINSLALGGVALITNLYRHITRSQWVNCMLHCGCSSLVVWVTYKMVYMRVIAECWVHDDVIKWKKFPHYWPFVRGIRR